MKKLIVLFLVFTLITTPVFADDPSVMGFKINRQSCSQMNKLSSIANQMTTVNWKVMGSGITTGVVTNPSAIIDMCNTVFRLASLESEDAINLGLDTLNTMTGNKMDDQLALARQAWDLQSVAIDKSGKSRPMAEILTSANAAKLNRAVKNTAKFYDKHINPNDPINLKTQAQREADMNRLGRVAYKKALINDVSSCPKPTGKQIDPKIYEKEITPQLEEMDGDEAYVDFYRESLKKMAIKMFPSPALHAEYIKKLMNLEANGIRYDITVDTKNTQTTRVKEVTPTSDDPMAKKTEEYKDTIKTKYQTFRAVPDQETLEEMIKMYSGKWDDYIMSRSTETTKNILNGPSLRVEDEFKDWNLLCNRGEIRKTLDSKHPNFERLFQIEYDKCKTKKNNEIKEQGGLYKVYITEFFNKLQSFKSRQAHVWTFESYHLGYFRSINGSTNSEGYTQEEAKCTPINNMAALESMALEQDALNLEINQMLVEQAMKQTELQQQQLAKQKSDEEELKRRREIEDEVRRRQALEYGSKVTFPSIPGI